MNSDTWKRASALFDQLYELSEEEQQEHLSKLAQSDPDLYNKMMTIYGFSSIGDGFLEEDVLSSYRDLLGDIADGLPQAEPMEGRLIGTYRIIRQIGYGGMGSVYLAERADGAFERQVALKFIRTELQHKTVIARFKREQRIQASLRHEAIPQLYDAGTDEHGTPYIVMDYVDGEPVTDYVSRVKPDISEILQLFERICEVIHFAHQNLIIHRDLKPSNIFINADGDIRLLDFGIAKLVDAEPDPDADPVDVARQAEAKTLLNFFSLRYAAPEQVKGEPVTTATDIYALGLILHEMLTGVLPYDITDATPAETERIICVDSVDPPSVLLQNTSENSSYYKQRSTELRGDLDTIIVKTLQKEPLQRYASVSAIADDIRRFRSNEPVLARRPSRMYIMRKFIQRNIAASVATATALIILLSGMVYHSVTVSSERDIAQMEADKFSQMAGFLINLFDYDQLAVPPEEATVINLLEAGVERLQTELSDNPEVRAEIMMAVGRSFSQFGNNQAAFELIRDGAELLIAMGGGHTLSVSQAYTELASAQFRIGNPESLETIDIALELSLAEHGMYSPEHALAIQRKATFLYRIEEGNEENRREAEKLFDDYLRIMTAIYSPGDSEYTLAIVEHAMYRVDMEERMQAYERALALTKEIHGRYFHRVANVYNSMAFDIRASDPERSIGYFNEALEIYNELYGENHHRTITTMTNLSSALRRLGRVDEAVDVLRQSVDGARRLYQPGSSRIADQQFWLANAYLGKGELDVAGPLFLEVLEVYDVHYEAGSQKPELARTLAGQVLMSIGRETEGRALVEQSIANTIALHGESHSMVAFSRARLN